VTTQLSSGALHSKLKSIHVKAAGFFPVIAISLRPQERTLGTISFASTLYLCPILDMLLAEIPLQWRAELRLGLQEALVNAAKHGNKLDPSKTVVVRFSAIGDEYWWAITDQGSGFTPPLRCNSDCSEQLPGEDGECGRGLFILYQIFDKVHWDKQGTELKLSKNISSRSRLPLLC
jgi:anti-sigma regulatory factor (Ser/Thr protein kinase)